MKIQNIHAREILDSRGIPTISTEVELWSGDKGKGEVPSGASTGTSEVLELRDEDGHVSKAVENVNTVISEAIKERDFTSQKDFDNFLIDLDGTTQKSKLGGNTILSCSMAFCRASANALGLQLYEYFGMIYEDKDYNPETLRLPRPLILVLEGGKHGDWSTDIQEYMVAPKMDKFDSFADAFKAGTDIFHTIRDVLKAKGYSTGVGFEGAYAPKEIQSNKEAFDIIMEGIVKAEYKPGEDFEIAIDAAASEFYNAEKKVYTLHRENKELTSEEWMALQEEWYTQYPMFSIEDPFDQEDWNTWDTFMEKHGSKYQIVGDDLLTTNVLRIQRAIDEKTVNSVLIKLNQIGTVTETLDAIRLTVDNNMTAIISHRGGETNDDMIADLSVGTPAQQCKFGGPDRGERLAKYNRLLEIEEILNQ
ncbi:phosphopyruvate hydratase [Patescibacteria group bacterium]|nr:phosphopyruvate hydratase [Patescibacteria group bacterium]